MQLKHPVIITPRLLAGVQIGDGFVSIAYSDRAGSHGKTRYRYWIDLPDSFCVTDHKAEYTADDLQSGAMGGGLRGGLESLLGFLESAGESYRYQLSNGVATLDPDSNAAMFPASVSEWAYIHSDEIGMARTEVEENLDCIEE